MLLQTDCAAVTTVIPEKRQNRSIYRLRGLKESWGCTLTPPDEYDGPICAAATIRCSYRSCIATCSLIRVAGMSWAIEDFIAA